MGGLSRDTGSSTQQKVRIHLGVFLKPVTVSHKHSHQLVAPERAPLQKSHFKKPLESGVSGYRKALGLARGSFWLRYRTVNHTPMNSVKLKNIPMPPVILSPLRIA